MVSNKFVSNLVNNVNREMGDLLAGQVQWHPIGAGTDQYKGVGDDLKTALIPFRKSSYKAEEYIYLRVPLKDPLVTYFDFVAPVLNIKDVSVQGVGTFVTHIPIPCKETYVERMIGLGYKLVPHNLVVDQGRKPKEVVKGGMITSAAINAINEDKSVNRTLCGNMSRDVPGGIISSKTYQIKFDGFGYPGGMTSVVPYYNCTVLTARDAGSSGAMADSPSYDFKGRVDAFRGIANALNANPEWGELEGKFYMDEPLEMLLPPILSYLKSAAQAPPQQ
jgi:hypothetical protein